jgi:hypothetical protein
MKVTTFISVPQRGQGMGSISYTRLMSMAQVLLQRAAATPEAPPGLDDSVPARRDFSAL